MSPVLELAPSLSQAGLVKQGRVLEAVEGANVKVRIDGVVAVVECQVLHSGGSGIRLAEGDAVLVWLQDDDLRAAVVLGRTGPYAPPAEPVVAQKDFAARPETLVLEAQGDVVLRNGQAKIKLGADGNVEIVCASFATRCQRLLRLLAPMIKLN
jgi:translation initiation factor IF-1